MFIVVMPNKKTGKSYVYLKESYRNSDGVPRTKLVQSFGRLDLLLEKDPLALEKLKSRYNNTGLKSEARQEKLLSSTLGELEGNNADVKLLAPVNYGMMPLMKIWDDDFALSYKIDYLKKQHTKIEFNLSSYIAFLCLIKVIDPRSVLSSYASALEYAGDFLKDSRMDELYRCYDFLSDYKDALLHHVNRRLDDTLRQGHAPTMVFYDVTNVYFETMLTDEEKGWYRESAATNLIEIIRQAIKEGNDTVLDAVVTDVNGEFKCIDIQKLPDELRQRFKEGTYLRMRGPSKEHRNDLPLVSIALVIDEWGMPIDFELYSGCASEYVTMQNSITKMKEKYHIEDTVVVADRGLNSTGNLKMLLDKQLGFLVAQRITTADTQLLKLIDDKDDWQEITNSETDWRYKVVPDYVKTNGKDTVDCTLVIVFNAEREKRDLTVLNLDWEKAQKAVRNKQEIGASRQSWTTLVKRDHKTPVAASLNTVAYEKHKKLCGFSAFVYHKAPNSEHELTNREIIDSYHRLERIEENFRVMKHSLSLRPMFVRTEKHIRGHILLCVLALLIIRTLQIKLDRQGNPLSAERIAEALSKAQMLPVKSSSNDNDLTYLNCSALNHLSFNKDELAHKAIGYDDLIRKISTEISDTDKIMIACGLEPLPACFNRATFCKCIRRRYGSDEDLVTKGKMNLLQ